MFRVETFSNPTEFYRNLEFNNEDLHINPVYSIAESMKSRAKEAGTKRVAIYSYKVLVERLFPQWHSPYTKLYFFSKIRSLLRIYASGSQRRSLETKIEEIYQSFVYTVELFGISLVDLPELMEEQRIFLKIVQELNEELIVKDYIKQKAFLTKGKLAETLQLTEINKIYVYQLDVLDASRMMFFHLLRKAGLEVVFRIPYDCRFQKVYEGWRITYEKVSNQRASEWSSIENTVTNRGTLFAAHLDGKEACKDNSTTVKTLQFDNPVDFKQYIINNPLVDGSHEVIANHYMDLNHYVVIEEKHKFFSKPYGKFILYLNRCKKEKDEIEISYETFVELITSGWIQSTAVTGMSATAFLIDLEPYMDGVSTLTDIKNRLLSLVELQDVSKEFDQLAKEQVGQHRIKRYLSNPFRAYPFVHQNRYSITAKQLIELTRDLERKLNILLLPKDSSVQVSKYLTEITKIFEQVKGSWPKDDAEFFSHAIQISIEENWMFEQEELLQLLTLKLNKNQEEKKDENKIKPLVQLPGAVLRKSALHITDLSLKSFPEQNKLTPEFITHTWMKISVQHSFASANREMRIHALLVDYYAGTAGQAFSLYQIYYALAFHEGELTFSWIDNLQENDSPSMYLQMIQNLYNPGEAIHSYGKTEIEEYNWDLETESETPIDVEEFPKNIPELYWLDYDFCAKKFYYTSFLQHQPIYESDFHQQLVFATLGKLLSQQGAGREEFTELIYPLFPQWTKTKKDNLIDTEYYREFRLYKHFESISYPFAFNRIQVLRSQYRPTKRYKMKNQYKENRFKLKEAAIEFLSFIQNNDIKGEAGTHCRMCPHLSVCQEGEYVIDAIKDGTT